MVIVLIFGLGKMASDNASTNYKIKQERREKKKKTAEHHSKLKKLLAKEAELRNAINDQPQDCRLRLDLAETLYSSDKVQEAIDELLFIVARNTNWEDGLARKRLLAIFDDLGDDDPIVIRARHRLSSILFL